MLIPQGTTPKNRAAAYPGVSIINILSRCLISQEEILKLRKLGNARNLKYFWLRTVGTEMCIMLTKYCIGTCIFDRRLTIPTTQTNLAKQPEETLDK